MTARKPAATLEVVGVPTEVATRLASIHQKAGGLRDVDVLADARKKTSPLHSHFEWDDTAAAEAHRLAQAGALIRRVHVKVITEPESEPIRVRAYIANRDLPERSPDDVGPGQYTAIQDVARKTTYATAVEESIRRDLARLQVKYSSATEFFRVLREVVEGD